MSDLCDDADILIEQNRDHALAQIPRYTGISAKECECGEEIPEGRRQAIPGVRLCAECKTLDDLKRQGVKRG